MTQSRLCLRLQKERMWWWFRWYAICQQLSCLSMCGKALGADFLRSKTRISSLSWYMKALTCPERGSSIATILDYQCYSYPITISSDHFLFISSHGCHWVRPSSFLACFYWLASLAGNHFLVFTCSLVAHSWLLIPSSNLQRLIYPLPYIPREKITTLIRHLHHDIRKPNCHKILHWGEPLAELICELMARVLSRWCCIKEQRGMAISHISVSPTSLLHSL